MIINKKKKKDLTDEWKIWALNWHYTLMRLFDKLFFFIFVYLSVLGLSCHMWDLVPRPGI